jgi:hypothetical protein
MTTAFPRSDGAASVPPYELVLDPRHEHGAECFWDVHECRWRCRPPARISGGREGAAG